jgi:hypothetical protein
MTLNDGHVFCAPEQVEAEIASILDLVGQAYRVLAIPAPVLGLLRRGAGPKYGGETELWDRAEAMVRSALAGLHLDYVEAEGEAACYGPKIDLQVTGPQSHGAGPRTGPSPAITPAGRRPLRRPGHPASRQPASRHPASQGSTISSHPSGRDRDLSIRCRRRSVREGAAAAASA